MKKTMSCPNSWIFVGQMVEHYSATAEAICSNPVEVQTFLGFICSCLKCNYHCISLFKIIVFILFIIITIIYRLR